VGAEIEDAGLGCLPDGGEGAGGGYPLNLNPQIRRKKRRGGEVT
jgi:hypothetical protein